MDTFPSYDFDSFSSILVASSRIRQNLALVKSARVCTHRHCEVAHICLA
jgi:hypothetical protein